MALEPVRARLMWLDEALEAGEIDEDTWYHEVATVIERAYLAADNPRAQSGHSGDERHWEQARSLVADAIDRDGTFLDVGCASGHLMECLVPWARSRRLRVEPYGLDISPGLADLARRRLPRWADRVHTGNAIGWAPPQRFDYVRTGLEYVPASRRQEFVTRLLREVVAPGGRLILGTYNERRDDLLHGPSMRDTVASWGFRIAGTSERRHYKDPELMYRVLWIDAALRGT